VRGSIRSSPHRTFTREKMKLQKCLSSVACHPIKCLTPRDAYVLREISTSQKGQYNDMKTDTATDNIGLETAKTANGENLSGSLSQVVSFRLDKEEYGLNIMDVQEIILISDITEIPEVPDFVRGLINLRGKVIPIVDLRVRFGLPATEKTEHTRIIVSNNGSITFGIVVDAVNEVLRIEQNQIDPPPKGMSTADSDYVMGLVKMEEKIMILLDINKIMSNKDKKALAETAKAAA